MTNDFTPSDFKYGLCSYFALAYAETHHLTGDCILGVFEWDDVLEKDYLVHFLICEDNAFRDALGVYPSWESGIADIEDSEFMQLSAKIVNTAFVRQQIEHDLGFSSAIYAAAHAIVQDGHNM